MDTTLETVDLKALNALSPEELLAWAFATHAEKSGIITSFQRTGCVLIDMAQRVARGMRVMTVDTLRLPRQTYEVMEAIEAKYGLTIERFAPEPQRVAKMVQQHGEFLFFDSKEKQEYCCHIRKVEPNERALATLDVWITGLRRDQSGGRAGTEKAALIRRNGRDLIRLAPLAEWSEDDAKAYMDQNGVPENGLYALGYTSIGCEICSTPTLPHESKRAGRWRWFNYLDGDHKECGIHTQGSGI